MATPEVTYDDLIYDLVRYGGEDEAHWRQKYPAMSLALFNEAMSASDECPLCLSRFISIPTVSHAFGCPVGDGTIANLIERNP